MANNEHLFVYGTLRRGGGAPLSRLLSEMADFVGLGSFQGKLYDLGEYPGVIPSTNSNDAVIGEIYSLHSGDILLSLLDEYEGYYPDQPENCLYLRKMVSIFQGINRSTQAWIYLYNCSVTGYKQIDTGDYLHYLNSSIA